MTTMEARVAPGTGSGLLGKCGWCGIDQKCVACKGIECKLATKCAAHQMVTSAQQCPAPRAHSPCIGNSSSLTALECAAWQDLFDGIGAQPHPLQSVSRPLL